MEWDSWLQAERHATASGFWGTFQWIVGGASAVLAAAASGSAFSNNTTVAGLLALGATATAALVTALRPGDVSARHLQSAASFNELQATARDLWELGLSDDPATRRDQLAALSTKWVEVTLASPRIPRRLLRKTDDFGRRGETYYPEPGGQPPLRPGTSTGQQPSR